MKRVIIIGSPGTGKTTFAKKMADKTGLPLIHLDFYHHDSKHDYPHDDAGWKIVVNELISKETWIIDGNYNASLTERAARADTIIYFDFPKRKAVVGVVKRRVKPDKVPRTDMPSDWQEHLDFGFLKYVWNFSTNQQPKIRDTIAGAKGKNIVVFKTRAEAQNYLERL